MDEQAVMICGIRRDADGTYVVTDALQRSHYAGDATGLGKLLESLYKDPDLPRSVTDTPKQNEIVSAVGKIARKIAKDPDQARLVDHLEPLAHLIGNEVAKRSRTRGPSRRRTRPRG